MNHLTIARIAKRRNQLTLCPSQTDSEACLSSRRRLQRWNGNCSLAKLGPAPSGSQTVEPGASKGATMDEIKGIARVKFHPGKFEEWKRLTEEAMEIVRTRDSGTLQYEISF